jgi:hypothetical protein
MLLCFTITDAPPPVERPRATLRMRGITYTAPLATTTSSTANSTGSKGSHAAVDRYT